MRNPQVRALAAVELFAGTTRRQRRSVTHLGTTLRLGPGRVMCRQGDESQEFFVVLDGVIALTGLPDQIVLLRSGDWWGEAALSSASRRHEATATTATQVDVLVYDRREFRALVELCPPVARRLAWSRVDDARPRALAPRPQPVPAPAPSPTPTPASA